MRALRAFARWLDRLARAIYARIGGSASDAEVAYDQPSADEWAAADAPAHWLARVRAKGPPADWLERVRRARLLNPHADFIGRANLNQLDSSEVQRVVAAIPTADAEQQTVTSSERASATRPREIVRRQSRKPLRFHRARRDADETTRQQRAREADQGVEAIANEHQSVNASMLSAAAPLKSGEPLTVDARAERRNSTDATRTPARPTKASPAILRARAADHNTTQRVAKAARTSEFVEPPPAVERGGDQHDLSLPVRARHESHGDTPTTRISHTNMRADSRDRVPSAIEHIALPSAAEWHGRWPPIITHPRAADDANGVKSASQHMQPETSGRGASRAADAQWGAVFSTHDPARSVSWPEPMLERWPALPSDTAESEPSSPAALRDLERWQRLDAEQREV